MKSHSIHGNKSSEGIAFDSLNREWGGNMSIHFFGFDQDAVVFYDAVTAVRDKIVAIAHPDFSGFRDGKSFPKKLLPSPVRKAPADAAKPSPKSRQGAQSSSHKLLATTPTIVQGVLSYSTILHARPVIFRDKTKPKTFEPTPKDALVYLQNGGDAGAPLYSAAPEGWQHLNTQQFSEAKSNLSGFPNDRVQVLLVGQENRLLSQRPQSCSLLRMNPGTQFMMTFDAGIDAPPGAPIVVQYNGVSVTASYPPGIKIAYDDDDD